MCGYIKAMEKLVINSQTVPGSQRSEDNTHLSDLLLVLRCWVPTPRFPLWEQHWGVELQVPAAGDGPFKLGGSGGKGRFVWSWSRLGFFRVKEKVRLKSSPELEDLRSRD